MAWLTGKQNVVNAPTQPAPGLRVQNSAQGKIKPLVCGQVRIAGNLIWMGEIAAFAAQGQSGGKGGGGSDGGQAYNFYVDVAIGICAGPILSVDALYDSRGGVQTLAFYNATAFLGGYAQAAWGFLTTNFPDVALAYRGIAYCGFAPFSMGSSPDLPNLNFQVTAGIANATPGLPDADPRDWITYLMSDDYEGVAFPSARLGAMDAYSSYCRATGMLFSHALVQQQALASTLQDYAQATNSDFRWSGGILDMVPYGDTTISAGDSTAASETHTIPISPYQITVDHAATFIVSHSVVFQATGIALARVTSAPAAGQYMVDETTGIYTFAAANSGTNVTIAYDWAAVASFVPNTTPVFDLVDDDYLPNQGSIGSGSSSGDEPITVLRKPRDQVLNEIKLEYLDRGNDFNPIAISAKDVAGIQVYGRKPSGLRSFHMFALGSAASLSASLQLNREQIIATFSFTIGPWAILADVMDLLTCSRTQMNMLRQGVRIIEQIENDDGSITFVAEEYLGTASAPAYGRQATAGASRNINADPGPINDPVIFEPTSELIGNGTLEIWGAISGVNTDVWGGYNVYVSLDGGDNYSLINPAPIRGAARMGVLSAPLPTIAVNPTGVTIDATNTLAVDLTESAAALASASQADLLALASACYVGGEIIAYRDAALTGPNAYNLTYLARGVYGTESSIGLHAAGTKFARMDRGVFRIPYDQNQIGSQIYIKIASFNIFGGGAQDLADIGSIIYTITGEALKSPLAQVQNFTSKFVDNRLNGTWDEIDDFRNGIRYELRRGPSFDGAQILGTVAHPPFPFPGDGIYWVTGWVQPLASLIIRSEFPSSLEVVGATLNTNVVATFDCQAEGWPGTFVNAGVDTSLNAVRTSGAGDVLAEPDILSIDDILNLGGEVSGTYAPDFEVNIGRVAPTQITISMVGSGVPVGADILGVPDILSMPDILGSVSAQYIDVFAKVLISQDGVTYAPGIKYSPGVYVGMSFKFEFDLNTIDPQTVALLLSATITVDVPDRIDSRAIIAAVVTSLTNLTVPDVGLALTYVPDGFTAAAPFVGGPGGSPGSLPQIIVTWGDEQAGDVLSITGETLAGCTIQILNGGVGVTRNQVNIFPRGY